MHAKPDLRVRNSNEFVASGSVISLRYPTHKPINLTPEIRAAMNAVASKGMLLATELFDLLALFGARNKGRETQMSDAYDCLLYTSPSPRDLSTSRMPSSA